MKSEAKTTHTKTKSTPTEAKKIHLGYNIKRLREILGVKQEVLAERMLVSQQTVSKFENKESLADATLDKVASALDIPFEAIKEFSDDRIVEIVSNAFLESSSTSKLEEIHEKNVELFERMVELEQKLDMLEIYELKPYELKSSS